MLHTNPHPRHFLPVLRKDASILTFNPGFCGTKGVVRALQGDTWDSVFCRRAYLYPWVLVVMPGVPLPEVGRGMDPGKQGLPIREDEHSHGHTQMVPEISFTPQFLSASLVEFVG